MSRHPGLGLGILRAYVLRHVSRGLVSRVLQAPSVLLAFAVLTAGCRGNRDGQPHELVVFAAASMTEALGAVETKFEQEHPHVDVALNFAGSQSLRTQIENGARPQVFISANHKHMDALLDQKLVDQPETLAENELTIVVPADNPAGIESFADLPKAERLVLADVNVPVGAYAERAIRAGAAEHGADFAKRVLSRVVSRESHVRQTLQKVVLGEADAAIVYTTDAMAAGDKVRRIPIPRESNVVASYPIATVEGARHPRLGRQFVDFALSDSVKATLEEFGFRAVSTVASKP